LASAECVRIGLALADTLEFLHRQELTHRDIKPSNIILVNNEPKLADVGLVTDAHPKQQQSLVGTVGYLPSLPGQAGTPGEPRWRFISVTRKTLAFERGSGQTRDIRQLRFLSKERDGMRLLLSGSQYQSRSLGGQRVVGAKQRHRWILISGFKRMPAVERRRARRSAFAPRTGAW
jgi:serine/threonine protein kinase